MPSHGKEYPADQPMNGKSFECRLSVVYGSLAFRVTHSNEVAGQYLHPHMARDGWVSGKRRRRKIRGILFKSPFTSQTATPNSLTTSSPSVNPKPTMAQQNVAHKSLQAQVSSTEKSDSDAIRLELVKNRTSLCLKRQRKQLRKSTK